MSHPEIPPKAKLFFYGLDYCGKESLWFELYSGGRLNMQRTEWLDRERKIVASYAEVEWRKRGERWLRLASRGGYRINFHSDATECLNMARAWRAWGSTK